MSPEIGIYATSAISLYHRGHPMCITEASQKGSLVFLQIGDTLPVPRNFLVPLSAKSAGEV